MPDSNAVSGCISFGNTEVDAAFLRNVDFDDFFYRVGQVVVQSGVGGVCVFSEAEDNALFIGLNLIKARCQPEQGNGGDYPADFEVKTTGLFDIGEVYHFSRRSSVFRFIPRAVVPPGAVVFGHCFLSLFNIRRLIYCFIFVYNINIH